MCLVKPEHVSMLTTFGTAFFLAGVISVLTGYTYYRRIITRTEHPFAYWSTTVGLLVLGGLTLIGLAVCPRG
jgi:hypothetical protein